MPRRSCHKGKKKGNQKRIENRRKNYVGEGQEQYMTPPYSPDRHFFWMPRPLRFLVVTPLGSPHVDDYSHYRYIG